RDPTTGLGLVSEVVITHETHPGPGSCNLADLIVVWEQTAPITAVESPTVGIIRGSPPQARSGNHRDGGWFIAVGPTIPAQHAVPPVSAHDLAPTVAHLLGVSLAEADGSRISALETARARP